ncbi:hypothetical protein OF83DRAFT_1047172, partial [Amylostereum chailletii]
GSLIPPPAGPLSKPKAGGYQLDLALGWDRCKYKDVQTTLHDIAKAHLNITLSYEQQTESSRKSFLAAARDRFTFLEEYVDVWPARDFARMYLKNKSA